MSDQTVPAPRAPDESQHPAWRVLGLIALAVLTTCLLVGGVLLIIACWPTWQAAVAGFVMVAAVFGILAYAAVTKLETEARKARHTTEELTCRIFDVLQPIEPDLEAGTYTSFVKERFTKPLLDYSSSAPRGKRVFTLVTFGSIVTALATSGLAVAAPDARAAIWVVFGLGLLGGTLSAINQVANPQRHATARYRAARALRREGWGLVLVIREYSELRTPDARFRRFACQVDDIVDSVEATDEAANPGSEPR